MVEVQARLKEAFADVRWENRDKFHVTLKFLGGVEESTLQQIIERLSGALSPFSHTRLVYTGLGCFPNKRNPRVIWVGCENEEGVLLRVFQTIEEIVEPLGFEKEKRAFHPHVTLGRVRSPKRAQDLIEKMKSLTFEQQVAECREVLVMKSDLRPSGSVYTVLHRIPLRKERNENSIA